MALVLTRENGRNVEQDYPIPTVISYTHGVVTVIGNRAVYEGFARNSLNGEASFPLTVSGLVGGVPLFTSVDCWQSDCVRSNAAGVVGTHLTSFDTITTILAIVNVVKGQQFQSASLLGLVVLLLGGTNGVTLAQGDNNTPITIRISGVVNPAILP